MDLPPSSVRRHIRPPPIRGPIEVHAYTDFDDDEEEEEEPNDVASLSLLSGYASTTWTSA